jgi:hypothetical protein
MHFYIAILLTMMGIVMTAPTPDKLQDWKITTNRHRYEERQNTESIWIPVDCPAIFSKRDITVAEGNLNRRYQLGGIYTCTQASWHGVCVYNVLQLYQCFELAPMWAGEIAAFGPDKEDFVCTLFSGANLTGNTMNVVFPGYGNLTTQGWGHNTTNPVLGISCWGLANV